MMDERMKVVLERTQKTLCRHLEDLNDQVEQDGGRIKDHMVLDGIKDCTQSLKNIKKVWAMCDNGNGETAATKSTATVTTVKQ